MRVLLAYDGSPGAETAVALAAEIPWPVDSTVRVAIVRELHTSAVPAVMLSPAGLVDSPELQQEIADQVAAEMDGVVRRLSRPRLEVEGAVLRGRPASVLIDEAASFGADVLIVGSRGRGPLASLVLGSVSQELAEFAGCPVLVARRDTLSRVVLATDGSQDARRAEDAVAGWPIFAGADVRVVSVAEVARAWHTGVAPTMVRAVEEAYAKDVEAATTAHEAIAIAAVERLETAGVRATHAVHVADAAGGVVDEAREFGADLIVVGSRGLTGLSRILLGSVARNVLLATDASVLVVKEPAGLG